MEPHLYRRQLNRMSRKIYVPCLRSCSSISRSRKRQSGFWKNRKKELEFLNAMLSDRLTLAQKKRFGASSEKYAEGYTQLSLFNEAEQEADQNAPEPELEEVHPLRIREKNVPG